MMPCNSTSPISKLPAEILSQILTLVRNDSKSGEFLFCLQCCRYWKDLALPTLYRDVVLHKATIGLFIAALTHHKAAFVRSLTLEILSVPDLPFTRHTEHASKLWLDIQNLAPHIRNLTSLATFSVTVTCSEDYTGPYNAAIRRMDIKGLFQAIPASCRSIELDTEGYDRYIATSGGHICATLQELLPQLHHLRLRAQRLCPAIFGDHRLRCETTDLPHSDISLQAPHLQTMLVSTIVLPKIEGADLCYAYVDARRLNAHNAMITSARRLFRSGALPAIQMFSFIDNVEPQDRMTFGNQATFTKNDIISNEEYVQLVEPLHPERIRCRPTPRNAAVVFGSLEAIGDIAEGVPWLETSNGSRFPSSFASTQAAIDAGYKWNRPVVKSSVDTKERDLTMWTYEQRRCS